MLRAVLGALAKGQLETAIEELRRYDPELPCDLNDPFIAPSGQAFRSILNYVLQRYIRGDVAHALLNLRDKKGSLVIDVNQREDAETTPVSTALLNFHYIILFRLFNLRDNTGKIICDSARDADYRSHPGIQEAQTSKILDIVPISQKQNGFTCGYNCLSLVTQYWNLIDSRFTRHYVRQKEDPRGEQAQPALRKLAKKTLNKADIGVGGIFNVGFFAPMLQETQYHAHALEFSSEAEMFEKIKTSIEHQLPVIISLEMQNDMIVCTDGKNAHYVTVIGFSKTTLGEIRLQCIDSYQYRHLDLKGVFNSSDNLRQTSPQTFYKNKRRSWRRTDAQKEPDAKTYEEGSIDLQHLRKKMVLVYPKELRSKYDSLFQKAAEPEPKTPRPD